MHRDERAVPMASQFESDFRKTLVSLEIEVHHLIASGWNESLRRRASEMAAALHDASRTAGWRERACALQALRALLALPLREILSIREPVRDKMLELLEHLLISVRSQTA